MGLYMKKDFIPVLLGSDQNVYGMARSFHMEYGCVSEAIGRGALPATSDSKIVKVVISEPDLEDDEVFVKTLVGYAREKAKGEDAGVPLLLVSCGDNYTKLLARNGDRIKDYFRFVCPTEEIYDRLSIKENFYQVCRENGFDFPRTEVCTYENRAELELPFDFPVVVKPSNSVAYWNCTFPGKKKVFVIKSAEELKAVLEAIYSSSYKDDIILQEFIPGEDNMMRVVNCYCAKNDTTGNRVRLFAVGNVLLEEHTAQGIGSYAAIIPGKDDGLKKRITDFLNAVGYTGFINIDIKLDRRDGKYKFFEMNLRQGRSSFFVTAAGCNLAKFLVDDLIYGKEYGTVSPEPDSCLWSVIPEKVIMKFVHDEELKAKAERLIKEKKFVRQLYYAPDMGFARTKMFVLNQANYMRKYNRNFGRKGYFDDK